jgi:hypothetical protein
MKPALFVRAITVARLQSDVLEYPEVRPDMRVDSCIQITGTPESPKPGQPLKPEGCSWHASRPSISPRIVHFFGFCNPDTTRKEVR